jgi:hypothetical protein
MRSDPILYHEKPTIIDSWVEGSAVECWPAGSWRISIAKIRYQETSSENTTEE